MKNFLAFCVLLLVLLPLNALGQLTDTTGLGTGERGSPRIYKLDTRAAAMGDATVADASRLTSFNINPALLAFVYDFSTIHLFSSQNLQNNLMFENAAFPVLALGSHRIAMQATMHHSGFDLVNITGTPSLPEPDIQMYQMDLAYAFSFENLVSVGFMSNLSLMRADNAQYWTTHTTLGLAYAPSQSVSYGIAFRGLGRSPIYEILDDGSTILASQNLRESLELGASLQFPDISTPYLSVAFANEKRFGENGIWYKVGAEYIVANSIALRSGLILHPENRIFAPRFGLAFSSELIKFEYALSYHKELYERFHQLGIVLNLN